MEITYRNGSENLLWSDQNLRAYLVHGEEDVSKSVVEHALIQRYTLTDFVDFDVEIMNAEGVSANAVLAAASQAPFGSDRRVVVVRGMEQWRDRTHAAQLDHLAAGISGLPASACLILIVGAEEEEARRKTAMSPKLDAAVQQIGMLVACRGLRGDALLDWLLDRFNEEGRRIDSDAAELLIANVGSEMRFLDLEIFKLANYVEASHSITTVDVSKVVATQSEDVMFQCVEAISRKQTDRALRLLHELHIHDPKPQAVAGRLLALLLRQFKLMWQAKHLASMGVPARDIRFLTPEVAAELPTEVSITQVAFKASALYSMVARYSSEEMLCVFNWLLLCDLANKGGVTEEEAQFSADPTANLQLLVLQLTGA